MNTDNYNAWQAALKDRDNALYGLLILAAILVGSYLITYSKILPDPWGKRLRLAYEIGGALLYFGIIAICGLRG